MGQQEQGTTANPVQISSQACSSSPSIDIGYEGRHIGSTGAGLLHQVADGALTGMQLRQQRLVLLLQQADMGAT